MRTILSLSVLLAALLLAGAALHAEEGESELDQAKRKNRAYHLTVDLLERRVRALESRNEALFQQLVRGIEIQKTAREATKTRMALLGRQIDDLLEDLETERKRTQVDDATLREQLTREQARHMRDVQQLMVELSTANETAEANRIEATQSLQRVQVVEEEKLLQRDHFVHAIRLLGEIGPTASLALPWLKETADRGDPVLTEAAAKAVGRIAGER